MNVARPLAALVLGAALLVPVTTASTAGAATLPSRATTTDAKGDVTYVLITEDGPKPGGKAPGRKLGDISTVQVTHTRTAVRVLIRYVDLARVGTDHLHAVQIRTPKRTYNAVVQATTGAWRGAATLLTATGSPLRCAMTWKLDYDLNTALISVPRTCIGSPAWIRAGAGMANTYGVKRYSDDGLTAARAGIQLVLGPKLYN